MGGGGFPTAKEALGGEPGTGVRNPLLACSSRAAKWLHLLRQTRRERLPWGLHANCNKISGDGGVASPPGALWDLAVLMLISMENAKLKKPPC